VSEKIYTFTFVGKVDKWILDSMEQTLVECGIPIEYRDVKGL